MGKWLQTMADAYRDICAGEHPWVALGNFMNAWYDYAKDQRHALVIEPLPDPVPASPELHQWAAFCAASVEYLCTRYNVACPAWVQRPDYYLPEPWFHAFHPEKPQVRARLLETTPEPFAKRNIYCGNKVFANKYELAEEIRQRRSAQTLKG